MEKNIVIGRLAQLDTYQAWLAAQSAQTRAAKARPVRIDMHNPEHIRQQMAYLDAEMGQLATRQALLVEIAEQGDEFLGVPYRLGLLAAFETTKQIDAPSLLPGRDELVHGRPRTTYVDRSEQPVFPSRAPVARALEIADELLRVQQLLDTSEPVPVAMVWRHTGDSFEDYSEVAVGVVAEPEGAFKLVPPRMAVVDGIETVEFHIPTRLQGVEKGEVIGNIRYRRADKVYSHPRIPTLRKLAGKSVDDGDPEALYIGESAVNERAQRARDEEFVARDTKRLRGARRRQLRR